MIYFPGSSDGKVSVYNVGDPGLIPGSGLNVKLKQTKKNDSNELIHKIEIDS